MVIIELMTCIGFHLSRSCIFCWVYTNDGLFTPEWSTPGLQHTCSYNATQVENVAICRQCLPTHGLELSSLIFQVMVHTIALAQTLREEKLLIQSIFMLNAYAITL